MDARYFLGDSFLWCNTPEGNDYWYDTIHPIVVKIRKNGLPMKLKTINPRYNIKPLNFA